LADVGEGCEKGRECFTYRTKNSGLVIVGVGTVESQLKGGSKWARV
jgi:hypothetical protein